jgi:hypothetical protein
MYIITKNWRDKKPPLGSQLNFGHPLSRGLVGCWLMNEGGGLKVNDLISKNNGSLINGIVWQNQDILSKGVDGFINIGNSNNFNFTTQNFSVVFGIKHNSIQSTGTTKNTVFFYKGDYQVNGWYIQRSPSDTPIGSLSLTTNQSTVSQQTTTGADVVKVNEFGIYAVVRNGSNCKIYKNGIDTGATSANHLNPTSSSNNLQLGKYSSNTTNFFFDGTWRFAYIYNRALSPSEIQSLYVAPYQFIQPIRKIFYSFPEVVTTGYFYSTARCKAIMS